MERWTDKQNDRETGTDKQTDRQTDRQRDMQTHRQRDRHRDRYRRYVFEGALENIHCFCDSMVQIQEVNIDFSSVTATKEIQECNIHMMKLDVLLTY